MFYPPFQHACRVSIFTSLCSAVFVIQKGGHVFEVCEQKLLRDLAGRSGGNTSTVAVAMDVCLTKLPVWADSSPCFRPLGGLFHAKSAANFLNIVESKSIWHVIGPGLRESV